ncbi:MAG: fatty acid desaturase family protein [Pseudohaliea sp.]
MLIERTATGEGSGAVLDARDYLQADELAALCKRSDLRAWLLVTANWASIAAVLTPLALAPGPLTVLLALLLLPGRQLGLAVLMHEAGHGTLFASSRLNRLVGQWLCALPVFNDLPSYAAGHREHHRKAGTRDDPDLPNYAAYPVDRASFRRKVLRDLSGRTGLRLLAAVARGAAGGVTAGATRAGTRPFRQMLLVQAVLLALALLSGLPWLYAAWLGSFLTTFMLVIRLRQVAEHAAVPDLYHPDPRQNTRTVDAPWWQRWLLAPNGVNFHLEHHLLPRVPCYRLRRFHRLLRERGALDSVPATRSYGAVLSAVIGPAPAPA